jgi:Protein of unknown function (DUF3040)
MLSDGEQRRLADIESGLRAGDPQFVHRLESGHPRRRTLLAILVLVVAVAGTVVALVVGSVPLAVFGVVAAGGAVGVWVTHRRH